MNVTNPVPEPSSIGEKYPELAGLVDLMARLRGPGGCPWDAEQTHASLVQYLVEECWELIEAIESGDRDELIEELGDVLYQVLFHSDIAAHAGPGSDFTIEDVSAHMAAKMRSRHPHVFADAQARTPDEVMAVWDDLKAREKPHRRSVVDGIPFGMPALALASKLIGRAGKVGIKIADAAPASGSAFDSLGLPAAAEPAAVVNPGADPAEPEAELGRALLAVVADAHAAGLDPERALRAACRELAARIREAEAGGAAGMPMS